VCTPITISMRRHPPFSARLPTAQPARVRHPAALSPLLSFELAGELVEGESIREHFL
jgi:hypothetical protein